MHNEQIAGEAVDWFLQLREGSNDPEVRRGLTAWLRRSPEHVRAYLEITALWVDVPQVGTGAIGDARVLATRAKADDNVTELIPRPAGAPVARRRPALLAASLLLATVAGAVSWLLYPGGSLYSTGTGEQRTVTLPDRSTVELNSRTEIRIRFDASRRWVELKRGQALFTVARDPHRPFVVDSDDAKVRALGTAFDVYMKRTGTVVTVVEGRVEVDRGPASRVELDAGQQVTLPAIRSRRGIGTPRAADVPAVTAWTERRLVFESASLEEVVEEFNRHNLRPLVLKARFAADLRISAVFPSADPESLLRFLASQPGLRVRESSDGILIEAGK